MTLKWFFVVLMLFAGATVMPQARAQFSDPAAAVSAMTIPQSQQMQPAELAQMLKGKDAESPLLLQVGSHVMYRQAHISGSKYAGPGSEAAGLQLLERTVKGIPKDKLIVIYCGCCPWTRCPNMGPAYKRLRELGFTNVKGLYVAHNLGDDWVSKGYPTSRGE